jgi:hypothetical protein
MDGTAVAERPVRDKTDLTDLNLTPEELGEEAAERERVLGGSDEAIAFARQNATKAAQDRLEAEEQEKVVELKAEAGEPVGDMPPGEPRDTMIPPDKLMVSGTAKGSHRKWNGKAPGMVILNVKGMKIEVPDGEFKKGERLFFSGEAVIVSEGVKDKLDKDTKSVVDAVQEHSAVVLDFELRDDE